MRTWILIVLMTAPIGPWVGSAAEPEGSVESDTARPPRPILKGFTADPSIRAYGDTY